MSRPWLLSSLLALTLVVPPFALAPTAHATVMVPIPLEDMVENAAAIVHARVVRSGTRLVIGDEETLPHTLTELTVLEWLAGGDGRSQVVIDELGGTFPGGGMSIAGTPVYRAGDEVVVFLRSTPDGYRTMGMVQGQFVVRHGVPGVADVVVRDTTDIGLATWVGGPMSIEEGGRESMALDSFLDWIRSTVAQTERLSSSGEATGGGGR